MKNYISNESFFLSYNRVGQLAIGLWYIEISGVNGIVCLFPVIWRDKSLKDSTLQNKWFEDSMGAPEWLLLDNITPCRLPISELDRYLVLSPSCFPAHFWEYSYYYLLFTVLCHRAQMFRTVAAFGLRWKVITCSNAFSQSHIDPSSDHWTVWCFGEIHWCLSCCWICHNRRRTRVIETHSEWISWNEVLWARSITEICVWIILLQAAKRIT